MKAKPGFGRASRTTRRWGNVAAFLLWALFVLISVTAVGEVIRGVAVGCVAYFVYRVWIVGAWFCRYQREGVRLAKAGKTEEALGAFERSEQFWVRWHWLDQARAPLLGSNSRWPFAWTAQFNQANCLAAMGRYLEALNVADRLVHNHPDMLPAKTLRAELEAQLRES